MFLGYVQERFFVTVMNGTYHVFMSLSTHQRNNEYEASLVTGSLKYISEVTPRERDTGTLEAGVSFAVHP
jgi:hypothetical protein